MEIRLSYVHARTARAHVEDGALLVRIPHHWPRSEKEAALAKFQRWAARRSAELAMLPPPVDRPPLTEYELWKRVSQINSETLRVPVAGVRLGSARRTRLAQANCKTGVLTFSRFAVDGLPDRALRYLILHELAHLRVADHSPRFWDLVARHEPDWRRLRRLAQSHFQRAVASAARTPRRTTQQIAEPQLLDARPVSSQGSPRPAPGASFPLPASIAPDQLPVLMPLSALTAFDAEDDAEFRDIDFDDDDFDDFADTTRSRVPEGDRARGLAALAEDAEPQEELPPMQMALFPELVREYAID